MKFEIIGELEQIETNARAAKDDLVRVVDESGKDYVFAREQFAFVEVSDRVRRRLLRLQRAG